MNTLINTGTALALSDGQELAINYSMISDFIRFLDVKPKTVDTYRKALKQFFIYLNQNEISQPTRDDIIRYRDAVKSEHKATTTQAYMNAVKRFFAWTETKGLYPDVSKSVKNAKVERDTYRKDYFTANQLKLIVSYLEQDKTDEGLRNLALFRLCVTCALRTIEIERANIEDLKTRGGNTVLYVQGKGKDSKDVCVNVDVNAEKAIRDYLSTRPQAKGCDPLFVSTSNRNKNGRMSTRAIRGILKDAMIKAGFNSDRLTAHSLRHTGATLALQNGQPIEAVQQQLRHADISNTMIYAHLLDADANQCSNVVGSLF